MILLENISAGIYIIFPAPDSGSGFGSSNVFGRKGGRENDQKDYNFADRCSDIDRKCFYK